MDTLLRDILAAPAADTLGGDEELVVVENTQIKRKPVSQALEDMLVARFNATGPVIPDRIGTQRYMPYLLAQSGVPVGIAPNATIATNGTLTIPGGSALPTTYSGGIWLRFPANAVLGDSTGGIYWCVMSSTTAGTVYAGKIDAASEFVPYIGSTAGGAVTGSNSAYTQNTSEITLVNITVPENTLGAYGSILWQVNYLFANSGNNKTLSARLDGTSINSVTRTTTANQSWCRRTQNCGLTNRQTTTLGEEVNGTAPNPSITTKDTTTSLGLTFTAQLATATEFIIFYGLTVEVLPS